VLVEEKLCKWLTAGLALYKAHPLMIESIFYEGSQCGHPSALSDGMLVDLEKIWIPDEYAGGTLRWGASTFPILSNTTDTLTLTGDPSLVEPLDPFFYQIVPPAVAILTHFLTTETFTVLSSFAQVPTQMPCFTMRLERDAQSDTYLGENLERYAVDGVEFDLRSQGITGSYLLSIWTVNREATLYLYAWLMHYCLNSLPAFATWGLFDVALSGSDLDPALQYLAERAYTRHLLLTATRIERAVTTREVEWVSSFCIRVLAHYAQLRTCVPAME
jgi:hypothetical protein